MRKLWPLLICAIIGVPRVACAQDARANLARAEAAVKANPTSADAWCRLATAARRAGKLDRALEAASKAVALDPKSVQAHHQLALVYKARGDAEKSIAEWQAALKLDPTFQKGLYNIGVAHYDLAQALLAESEALAAKRRRREAAAKAKEAAPHIAAAKASWEAALKLKEDHAPSHYNLGVLAHRAGNYDEAVRQYRRTLELNERHVKAHVNLGLCLARQDKQAEAMAQWKRAEELDPKLYEPCYNEGVLLAQEGKFAEAVACWQKARDILKPQLDTAKKNNAPDVQPLAQQLGLTWYNLGVAHESMKDLKQAESCLKQAVECDPNLDEAWQVLRAIQRR